MSVDTKQLRELADACRALCRICKANRDDCASFGPCDTFKKAVQDLHAACDRDTISELCDLADRAKALRGEVLTLRQSLDRTLNRDLRCPSCKQYGFLANTIDLDATGHHRLKCRQCGRWHVLSEWVPDWFDTFLIPSALQPTEEGHE